MSPSEENSSNHHLNNSNTHQQPSPSKSSISFEGLLESPHSFSNTTKVLPTIIGNTTNTTNTTNSTNSTSSSSKHFQNDNDIKLYLSRSIYPLNSSIVGTITSKSAASLQNCKSIKVYVAGRCRVDSRWHYKDVQESIHKLHKSGGSGGSGGHPCHTANDLPSFVEEMAVSCYFKRSSANAAANAAANADGGVKNQENANANSNTNSNDAHMRPRSSSSKNHQTFCFWSTNVLTLCQNGNPNPAIPIFHDQNSSSSTHSSNALMMKNSTWYTAANRIENMIQQGEKIDWNELHDLDYHNEEEEEEEAEEAEDEVRETEQQINNHNNSKNDSDDEIIDQINNMDIATSNQGENQPLLDNPEQSEITMQKTTNKDTKKSPTPQTTTTTTTNTNINTNFTFKVDLPKDLPLTANAASARYFYSAVLVIQTNDDQTQILQAPFTVVTSKSMVLNELRSSNSSRNQSLAGSSASTSTTPAVQTKIRIGTINAIAHLTQNPISLSSTYEAEPWRTSVERVYGGWDTTNVRSITIEEDGYKCGRLTIVGGVVIHPGEKLLLEFDFEKNDDDYSNSNHDRDGYTYVVQKQPLPCYMVSACLQGVEYALSKEKNIKKKSRSYVFDTAYSHIDPDCTRNASLNLSLPLDCPMTLNTDLVKIDISCRVDLTVRIPHSDSFKFLTVEFPCHVISGLARGICDEEEKMGYDDDSMLSKDIVNKIMDCKKMTGRRDDTNDIDATYYGSGNDCHKVICPEILDDLSMLTMHILECNK